MYDISISDAEVLAKAASALLQLKPLLETKKVETLIKGIDEAKKTLESKAEVDKRLQKAIDIENSNQESLAAIAEDNKVLEAREAAINARELAVKSSEQDIKAAQGKTAREYDAVLTQSADLGKRKALIEEREATIKFDLDAAAEAKKKAQTKLDALNNVPGE